MTRILVLLVALVALPGCPHRPVDPPAPPAHVVVDGCRLTQAPPARPKAPPVACPGFVACFPLAEAAELDRYLGEVDAWARDVWVRCGEPGP